MFRIDEQKLYKANETAKLIGNSIDTLARWRKEKREVAFIKMGSSVRYKGQDILDWLERNRVETSA